MKKRKAKVILYSKPGCHLCEVMKAEVRKANCAELYDFQEVNIEGDEQLRARYRFDIPVMTLDGEEAFRHRLTADEFKQALLHSNSVRG